MRLPRMSNPITSAASPLLTTTGISLHHTHSATDVSTLGANSLARGKSVASLNSNEGEMNRTDPLTTSAGLPKVDGHHLMNPVMARAVAAATGGSASDVPSADPLDLVIAKRKRKELADPVIAEAIRTASKLPPPRIPETQDKNQVPKEIQQLIEFGFERETSDPKSIEFFRNYPAHKPPPSPIKYTPLPSISRYKKFRRKILTGRPHRKRDDEDEEVEAFLGEEKKTSAPTAAKRSLIPTTVHADEDWFMENVLHVVCIIFIILTLPLSLIFCLKVVAHYERAVLFRLGRLVSATAQGPGLIIVLPCLDRYRILDLRTFTFDVPTQEVLTKDSVTVVVNAVVYYRVRDPVRAVVNVEDANRATRVLGQTTLRNVLGTVNLDQLLTAREDIAALMQECLDSVTEAWGVKVERVEIKDVRLPIQLQRAMAAEAESVREATAKVIAAEGEMRAAGALKAAAFEIKQHPIALQLRYLQAVNSISSGKESTIIFPVPLNLQSFFQTHNDPMAKTTLTGFDDELIHIDSKKMLECVQSSLEDLQAQIQAQTGGSGDLIDDYFGREQADPLSQIV
ncbi:hypothetical protein T265_01090 [Opisthorchis viverrini]|uniref:Band 7 domain-containing protein n=1 Tax=Opisthorchis viverrini TaxID=6198 RepID=A0A075A0W1_OPIVI|nr:hypothetical protein T265_01090 [Opisthorchis viverrini]KER33006.1 hypothetical protein T265_01090 [Opisthorchis viverrini]